MNFSPAVIHVKTMEWTNDDALELIEQYRGHTELWNRADPKYKDKLCRFRAWSEIAERFGCSKAEVERKMNVLLTQYRREKHKMLVKLYQGIQPNPSKWYAFKRFDFMEAGGGSAAVSIDRGGTNGHHTTGGSSSGGGSGGPLNGLAAAFETSSAAAAAAVATTTSHHRRMKSKEMKYFGAMGLNLPMLIANTQTLDTWNTVGQFSPPIGERNHLRVPMPISFSASQNDSSYANAATRSIFSSSNSDLTSSPQKPMDTTDIDEKDEKPERPHLESTTDDGNAADTASTSTERAAEGGSSPIPNTNMREAHKNRQRGESRDQDDLDIKQELVDFFHVPHPPGVGAPGSSRSYSSAEDNHRLGGVGSIGGIDSEDFAQDLRVSAAAAAAAAAKGIDFSQFVLPPRNLRRSSDSIDEKYSPLNMRKLSSTGGGSTAAAAAAGQMLMNSLMSSGESASEDGGRGGKNGSQDAANSSSAAAAAAALYAESLNKDDCDFIGSNVSLKLRSMDRTQRIIAEKLISEVLFYGQFNELERNARIQPK